jgi:hypothetical protein
VDRHGIELFGDACPGCDPEIVCFARPSIKTVFSFIDAKQGEYWVGGTAVGQQQWKIGQTTQRTHET